MTEACFLLCYQGEHLDKTDLFLHLSRNLSHTNVSFVIGHELSRGQKYTNVLVLGEKDDALKDSVGVLAKKEFRGVMPLFSVVAGGLSGYLWKMKGDDRNLFYHGRRFETFDKSLEKKGAREDVSYELHDRSSGENASIIIDALSNKKVEIKADMRCSLADLLKILAMADETDMKYISVLLSRQRE